MNASSSPQNPEPSSPGFSDAGDFGFSPEATGSVNLTALQQAVDQGGTIVVSQPGTYDLAGTVLIGSDTALAFGAGVSVRKVTDEGPFTHVLLNKGALTRTTDRNISVDGLQVVVNGVDHAMDKIYGLRGQIAFFHIKDLKITRFRCLDLGKAQFAIHICTFEDIIIDDLIVKGDKDGVHLGRGKRFTIRNGVFQTYDDAVALNGHDYASGNPEMGWIEDGVVENCHDLPDGKDPVGFFCRILAGAWIDWREGMEVQNSDSVISKGRLYRVQGKPDGTVYPSTTRPTHEAGSKVLDGITWGMVQEDAVDTAGVRNIVFRDIYIGKPRIAFSVHFDHDRFSRSYYPGARAPVQEQITLDHITVLHDQPIDLLSADTPVDALTITASTIRNNPIRFNQKSELVDHGKTTVNLIGCTFRQEGKMELLANTAERKQITFKSTASVILHDSFRATVSAADAKLRLESDLPGLAGGHQSNRSPWVDNFGRVQG